MGKCERHNLPYRVHPKSKQTSHTIRQQSDAATGKQLLSHLLKLMDRLRLSIEVVVPGLLVWHLLAMMLLCHCIWHLLCTKQCLRGCRLILMLAGQLLHCLLGGLPTGLKGSARGSKGRLPTGLKGRVRGSQGRLPTGLQGRVRGGKGGPMQRLKSGHWLPSLLGLPTTLGGKVGVKGRLPTKLRGRAGGKGG